MANMSRKGDGKFFSFLSGKSLSLLGVSTFIIAIDQISKYVISTSITIGQTIPVIKGMFHLTLVQNTGAGFGILQGMNGLLLAISTLVVGIIAYFWRQIIMQERHHIPVALILGGAIGNLIDRGMLGYVVDFIDFRIWPVFNIADSAITVGAILLAWQVWKK